jgi:hypothetical protein
MLLETASNPRLLQAKRFLSFMDPATQRKRSCGAPVVENASEYPGPIGTRRRNLSPPIPGRPDAAALADPAPGVDITAATAPSRQGDAPYPRAL